MKVPRKTVGKTLFGRERSKNIKSECNVENINEWVYKRKQEWNRHTDRMNVRRIVRIARDKFPAGRRSVGWPRRRWSDNMEEFSFVAERNRLL